MGNIGGVLRHGNLTHLTDASLSDESEVVFSVSLFEQSKRESHSGKRKNLISY